MTGCAYVKGRLIVNSFDPLGNHGSVEIFDIETHKHTNTQTHKHTNYIHKTKCIICHGCISCFMDICHSCVCVYI